MIGRFFGWATDHLTDALYPPACDCALLTEAEANRDTFEPLDSPEPGDSSLPGSGHPLRTTSELLELAAKLIGCLDTRHPTVTAITSDLRDRAAQFSALGD